MVKWLKRIVVTTSESDNYYHFKDNRVLPSHVDAELANAEAWWYKPEYIINELNINSVITTLCHEEILQINSHTTQRPYTMKGYAYSGELYNLHYTCTTIFQTQNKLRLSYKRV
ncbi:hypothetical protein C1H46_015586 [Malus baccata]|uniref:Moybdenum cofactor oxidoreductase dimerisation domain-containing protein n=1 Tax=Malus baccata TaxID=106549 RepID=A0A540MJ13_MALBA|nr:hypothetical protein C1H46_015586 [Malus baccata]